MISFIYFYIFPFILLYYSYKIMKNTYYVGEYYQEFSGLKVKIDVPIWAVIIAIILAFIPVANIISVSYFGIIYAFKVDTCGWKYFSPKAKNKFISKIKIKLKKPINKILTFLNKNAW